MRGDKLSLDSVSQRPLSVRETGTVFEEFLQRLNK